MVCLGLEGVLARSERFRDPEVLTLTSDVISYIRQISYCIQTIEGSIEDIINSDSGFELGVPVIFKDEVNAGNLFRHDC